MDADEETTIKFSDFGLNSRLEKSISNIGWQKPTLVQEKAIQFGLEGKDLLIKGRTGCGKTGAFLIPIIHNLLELKKTDHLAGIRCLILSPNKELCRQTAKICRELNYYTSKEIKILDLTEEIQFMKKFLLEKPEIIISTPSRLLQQLKNVNLNPALNDTLRFLVIDEADLMFSFGYKDDMNQLLELLPKGDCQTFLASATLNTDIVNMKELFLSNPIIIKLSENETNEKIVHNYLYVEEEDKFVLLNALFKFKLMPGRSLIFVNSVNRCYKLKIFLEQFGIKSALLNSELPLTSRCHAIDQFNRGIYDIIIANDERCVSNPEETSKKQRSSSFQKKKEKFKRDNEFSVSRGIDFQNVDNVINFDFPETKISYIHRVGRTGRGPHEDTDGTVLSLISMKEKRQFEAVQESLDASSKFKKFSYNVKELDSIRYRVKDAFHSITKIAINEARVKEIRQELLNSKKLQSYFRENLKDFKALKQEKSLHLVKPMPHLKNIPDYIVPDSLQSLMKADTSKRKWYDDDKPFYQAQPNQIKKKRSNPKKHNPLRSFQVQSKK